MPGFAPRPTNEQRPHSATQIRTICVVDPRAEDYRSWQDSVRDTQTQVEFLVTAEDALRRARHGDVALWVVNTCLPGISGFELCTMFRAQSSRSAVYLVADDYTPEVERRAWQARATMFGVKPLPEPLLREWLLLRDEQQAAPTSC